jgi:hypothetical protein
MHEPISTPGSLVDERRRVPRVGDKARIVGVRTGVVMIANAPVASSRRGGSFSYQRA